MRSSSSIVAPGGARAGVRSDRGRDRCRTGAHRSRWFIWVGPAVLAVTPFVLFQAEKLPAKADEPVAPRNAGQSHDSDRSERMERMLRTASDYELFVGANREKKLKRRKEAILRWSNPLRATDDGAVFLWTSVGRPAAMLSIYTYGENNVGHEFQSLAVGPLVATYHESEVWSPERGGIEFQPVPASPVPAATAALRLSQMRSLLRDFSAAVGRDQRRHELRLMTQPLYRYGDREGEVLDGGVFAFAQGTDPEMLVLLEARRNHEKPATWHFAAARMNMGNLELKHRDIIVWTIDDWNRKRDPREPYITFDHKLDP